MIGEDFDIDCDGDLDVVDYLILEDMVSDSEETSGNAGCFNMVILCVLAGVFFMTKADQIRKVAGEWPANASNRDVAKKVEQEYAWVPSAQHLYRTLGSETTRVLKSFSGHEMLECKATANSVFEGDYTRFSECVAAVRRYAE